MLLRSAMLRMYYFLIGQKGLFHLSFETKKSKRKVELSFVMYMWANSFSNRLSPFKCEWGTNYKFLTSC